VLELPEDDVLEPLEEPEDELLVLVDVPLVEEPLEEVLLPLELLDEEEPLEEVDPELELLDPLPEPLLELEELSRVSVSSKR
jgi:hypothetical protein